MSNFRWLLVMISWVRVGIGIGLILFTIKIIANLGMTGVQKWIIDDVFIAGNYDRAVLYLSIFTLCLIIFNSFHAIAAKYLDDSSFQLFRKLSRQIMQKLHAWPTSKLQKERTGKLVNHFSGDIEIVSAIVPGFIPQGIQHGVSLIAIGAFIGWASPVILLLILAVSAIYIWLARYFGPKVQKAAMEVRNRGSDLQVHIEESVSSTREVIAFHRLDWEERKFAAFYKKYFSAVIREGKLLSKQLLLSDPLRWIVTLAVLAVGGLLVVNNSMSIGTFVVLFQFAIQFMTAAQGLFNFAMQISGRMASVERLKRVLEHETWEEGKEQLQGPIASISFDQVSFRYGEDLPLVLKDLSIHIPAGQKIAFVGSSGGGKSTIAQLLVRFYPLQHGEILINGEPLQDIQRSDWSRRVNIVFQEPYFFPDSIRMNLLMGREHLSEEQIYAACETAQIKSLIDSLPEGLDTEIGERGITLSGGQRQRLAIARALLGTPEILILDEATSALDLETERMLQHAVDEARNGLTTIIIAHRLSTIQNADVIYVMQDGTIVEYGKHDDILSKGGLYASLFDKEHSVAGAVS
ncbi:ABC transporter ATP-binding protein [Paenibacillus paeoniae]|uniref:ABC transporter ATP-binding protein n=1 Tax=Paenibacillus paeoniae TaxID=2292705 RepID=A0A371PJT3_9BACL|nr:ABC transporter ATP-binding protein [Paenibacillus paeoniae]REK76195.1 ABC transporter ATP-binding protein [Paenibacillus paeoniae]